jgi:nucleoid DNA-binding protein
MKVEGSEFTKDELVNNLVEKYNIDIKKAETDVQKLLDKLKKEGLIDE